MRDTLRPGDRVRIMHCPAGWIPDRLLGTYGTVARVNGAGVTVATEECVGTWAERYVPRRLMHVLEKQR